MNITFSDYRYSAKDFRVEINTKPISERFARAQYYLDSQIMNDMVPLMPKNSELFINNTRAESAAMAGTGVICAAAPPYGAYLYYGKVMVDRETGKGPRKIPTGPGEYVLRFRKGAKLVPTDRALSYSSPTAVPRWFEAAKEAHLQQWIEGVERILNG